MALKKTTRSISSDSCSPSKNATGQHSVMVPLSPHLQGQTNAPACRKYDEDKRCVQAEGFEHICCDCLGLMAVCHSSQSRQSNLNLSKQQPRKAFLFTWLKLVNRMETWYNNGSGVAGIFPSWSIIIGSNHSRKWGNINISATFINCHWTNSRIGRHCWFKKEIHGKQL